MAGTRLHEHELRAEVARLKGWTLAGTERLTKEYSFPDFAQALAFVNRVGALAEALQHHPEITVGWGRVSVTTWSHDVGGLSARDIHLAEQIDARAVEHRD